ncbi:unnamed protein product, partial [Tetraodon nigroviridis]
SMQRALSSDTLNAAALGHAVSRSNNSDPQHDVRQPLSHSQSMFLPANGKLADQCRDYACNVTNIVVEPPSPESSPDSDGCTPVSKRTPFTLGIVNILVIFHKKAGNCSPCVGSRGPRPTMCILCLREKQPASIPHP